MPGEAGRGGKGSAPNRKEAERGMVPARVRPLREKREERSEKRAETDKHDADERIEGHKGLTSYLQSGWGHRAT